jgi:carbonic anhydrase/acetyltransferase-like protein (isoleucine patch superfamily)
LAIFELRDAAPRIAASAWVGESAQVIGRVTFPDLSLIVGAPAKR